MNGIAELKFLTCAFIPSNLVVCQERATTATRATTTVTTTAITKHSDSDSDNNNDDNDNVSGTTLISVTASAVFGDEWSSFSGPCRAVIVLPPSAGKV